VLSLRSAAAVAVTGLVAAACATGSVFAATPSASSLVRSARCPGMPGKVIASGRGLEVSRVRSADRSQEDFHLCFRRDGSYRHRLLFEVDAGTPVTVKLAGRYIAVSSTRVGSELVMFDPAWNDIELPVDDVTPGQRVGRIAVDRWGRLAWTESFTRAGRSWTRLRVRTQSGSAATFARRPGRNAITALRFSRDKVQWTTAGKTRTKRVVRPRCQVTGIRAQVLASSQQAMIMRREGPRNASSSILACLRSDGRWHVLTTESTDSSHGYEVTRTGTAGFKAGFSAFAINHDRADIVIVDLRSAHRVSRSLEQAYAFLDAVAADGRYVYEAFGAGVGPGGASELFAARPAGADIRLDEGTLQLLGDGPQAFTEVRIDNGVVSWNNAGLAKTTALP